MNFLYALTALAFMAQDTVPLYHVTVIERSLQAVNYQYKSGPTEIDFRGTVLLGKAKGHATVESRQGRTEIDAKLQGLTSPQGFGKEYLTYVLWAISPEGAPHNLGEIVTNGGNNSHVRVTTELQAFGLLVTAEPYAAVRQPSDVVVMENQVRTETIGTIQPIVAKAELLPRGHYVLDQQNREALLNSNEPKVSMNEYEEISQIYQAESALNVARAANADTLASDTFGKAQHLLDEAKQRRANKIGMAFVVQSAREAAQTADDARVIAVKRSQEKRIVDAEQRAAVAERALRENVPAAAPVASTPVVEEPQAAVPPPAPSYQQPMAPPAELRLKVRKEAQDAVNPQTLLRGRLLSELRHVTEPIDSPRGISVVIADADFTGGNLNSSAMVTLERVAQIVASSGLRVTVEGNSDSSAGEALSLRRAEAVRNALVTGGLRADYILARGLGNARPTTSNATEAGRMANRRVEIVIAGGAIGDAPLWDRPYPITRR